MKVLALPARRNRQDFPPNHARTLSLNESRFVSRKLRTADFAVKVGLSQELYGSSTPLISFWSVPEIIVITGEE